MSDLGHLAGETRRGRMAGKGATRTIGLTLSRCWEGKLWILELDLNLCWPVYVPEKLQYRVKTILNVIILNHLFTLHLCCSMLCNDVASPDLLTLKARNMA